MLGVALSPSPKSNQITLYRQPIYRETSVSSSLRFPQTDPLIHRVIHNSHISYKLSTTFPHFIHRPFTLTKSSNTRIILSTPFWLSPFHLSRLSCRSYIISIHTFTQNTIRLINLRGVISIHPHKMRLDRKNKIALSSVFQSTHPHRIQLQHIKIDTALVQISIHASSQNATAIISTFFAFLYVMCSS